MRIAVTADLHWGHGAAGDDATQLLLEHLRSEPPDLLLLGGDIGTASHFDDCLDAFRDLPCPKALIPGNHDLWVETDDPRGDSLGVYDSHLPALCATPVFITSMRRRWCCPSTAWPSSAPSTGTTTPGRSSGCRRRSRIGSGGCEHMAFTRGRHNDRRFVRWPLDDVRFTQRVVAAFESHLTAALGQVPRAVVLTHHPAFYDLGFPRGGPPSVPDGLLWDAFSGNTHMEEVLRRHAERIAVVFSGHTHRAREGRLDAIPGYNIGGDYGYKRLIVLDWPGGAVAMHQFGSNLV